MARPSSFTPVVLAEILERLTKGELAVAILKDPRLPSWPAFCAFKRANKEFQDLYALAVSDGMTTWENEINEIAHNESRDLQPDGKGGFKSDNTFVNRDRLKIDTKKWIMCKRYPALYGDKMQQEITGKDGKELIIQVNIRGKNDNA